MGSFLKRLITPRKKIKPEEQLRFIQLLDRLLDNGYPLLDALEAVEWNKEMRIPAQMITKCLKDGLTIDKSFELAGFHPVITSYLYFIKGNGDLNGSIHKCAVMYQERLKFMKKFRQTARYPLVLLIVFLFLLLFIRQNVLPAFMEIFESNTPSAATLQFSIILMEMAERIAILFILLLLLTGGIWAALRRRIPIEQQLRVYRYLPFYREYLKLQTSFHFATHFSSLLKTGMPYNEILAYMQNQQKLPVISHYAELISSQLSHGRQISGLLSVLAFMEKQLTSIFRKNNEASSLQKDLNIYSELLLEDIQRKIVKVLTLVQPVFFILLASFIIFIYLTLMWPMFQLIKTI